MTAIEALGTTGQIDDLLARAESLDGATFEAVYGHYHDALARYGAAQGSTDPEGVANLALFDVYRAFKRSPIRSEPQFRAYLYRAAKHHVIGEHRRKVATPIEVEDGVLSEADGTDALVTREWLMSLVDDLPPEQRSVIEHRYLEDLTAAQTGNELGKATNAVYQTQHRAISNLRRWVAAVAVVVAIVASITVWRQATDDRTFVDNAPADPTETTNVTAVDPGPQGETPIGDEFGGEPDGEIRSDNLDPDPVPVNEASGATTATVSEPDRAPVTEAPTPTTGIEPAVDSVTGTELQAEAEEQSAGTAASPSGGSKPEPPDTSGLGTRLTVCRQTQVQNGLTAFVFFRSESAQEARKFEAPEAIRFVGTKSALIDEYDVSLPSPSGVQSGSFGWLSIEGDAVAITSNPTGDATQEWGLVYNTAGSAWLNVKYLDFSAAGSPFWQDIDACAR